MFPVLARLIGVHRLPRSRGVPDRTVVLAMGARFLDELLSGVLIVAMPAIRTRLGMTVTQVGLCFQLLSSVAAVVEPMTGVAIDVARRRPLLLWGAIGTALAALLAAGAPSTGWLAGAFIVYATASGPLVQVGDVVLVEVHPGAEERISARADLIDTVGALLAPLAVGAASWSGLDERWVLGLAGVLGLGYALALRGAVLPAPACRPPHVRLRSQLRGNLADVLADPTARRWVGVLVVVEAIDATSLFAPVWLHDDIGMTQTLVAVHVGIEMVAALVALAVLDRVLERMDPVRVLRLATLASVVTGALWLTVGGPAAKLLLAVPHAIAMAPLWPIARARALAAVPGRAGTVSGVLALTGLLPLAAALGAAGQVLGLGPAMLVVHVVGTLLALLLLRGDGGRRRSRRRGLHPGGAAGHAVQSNHPPTSNCR